MAADAHKNFAYSTVATAPSPAASGTSLVVGSGDGTKFPTVSFNATIWPAGAQPTTANAEVVRVTAISTDTFTITRTQESTSARTVVVGDQIAATVTAKTLTDAEAAYGGQTATTQQAGFDALSPLTTAGDALVFSSSHNNRLGATLAGHTPMFDGTNTVMKVVRAQYDPGVVLTNVTSLTTILSATMSMKAPFVAGDMYRLVVPMAYFNNNTALTYQFDVRVGGTSFGALSLSAGAAPSASISPHHMFADIVFVPTVISASGTVAVGARHVVGKATAAGTWLDNAIEYTLQNAITVDTTGDLTFDVLGATGANASATLTPRFIELRRIPKL